jgi:hydroxyacylglutathione hydrolase
VPTSTVGYEKMFNASVRAARSEREFVDFILDAQPEPPLYFARMKRDNKLGPKVLGSVPRPAAMGIEDLKAVDVRKVAVIDTRPWAAFRAAHVPGSLHIPLNNTFNTDAGSLVAEDEPIVLIVEPSRVDEAVRDLIRVGLDRIVGWFDVSTMGALTAAGGTNATIDERTPEAARVMIDTVRPFVLDVRRKTEFEEGHIDGATNIAHTRLLSRLAEVPRDRPVLVNCRSGARSARACSLLRRHGYDCTNVAGGFLGWQKAFEPAGRA